MTAVNRILYARIVLIMAAALLAGVPGVATAQEAQVPLDEEGQVTVVDAALAQRLGLFTEYENFGEARLFRTGAGSYELVIQYTDDGQMLRDRRNLTEAEVSELRARISSQRAAAIGQQGVDQEGRYKLLAATTLLGAVEGALIPAALDVQSERVYASLPLFGAAAGFGVPFMLTRNRSVTEAEATMTWYGGLQGLVHGALAAVLVRGDAVSDELLSGSMALMTAGQAGLGYALADRWAIEAGTAELMGFGSFFGTGVGFGTSALIMGDNFDGDAARLTAATGLIVSVAGSSLGYHLGQRERFTQGDARLVARFGSFGTQLGINTLVVLDDFGTRLGAAVLVGGTLAGLEAGRRLVTGRDFTRGQANIVWLGSFAGLLLGSAVGIAADANEETAYTLSTLGTAVGLGLTYALYADEALAPSTASGWQFRAYPSALRLGSKPEPAVTFSVGRSF